MALLAAGLGAVEIVVEADTVITPRLVGLGHNLLIGDPSEEEWETVVGKRLSETNADGWARMFWPVKAFAPERDQRTWDSPAQQRIERVLATLKEIGTDVYLTNEYWSAHPAWLGGNQPIADPAMLEAWAEVQGEGLEHLVRRRGLTNVRWWCVTNELQTGGGNWFQELKDGVLVNMPSFERHSRLVHAQLKARGLAEQVGIVASDSLGRVDVWRGPLSPYCTEKMNDIAALWCVHDYAHGGDWYVQDPEREAGWVKFGSETGEDWAHPRHYGQILTRYRYGVWLTRGTEQPFTIGELGVCSAGGDVPNGRLDGGRGIDTADYALALADRIVAALNAGVAGVANWALVDTDTLYGSWKYMNHWGTFSNREHGWKPRPVHYAYGLLTRHVRKHGQTLKVTCPQRDVHVAAVRNADRSVSVIVINRTDAALPIDVRVPRLGLDGRRLRVHLFDPSSPPQTVDGDQPPHLRVVKVAAGRFVDEVPAGTLAVYASGFDDVPPAAPEDLAVTATADGCLLTWTKVADADVAYYRVYRGPAAGFTAGPATRIGSTIAGRFLDRDAADAVSCSYQVAAMDRSGNEAPRVAVPYAP